ncbi:MAG: hypothetical protein QOC97_425, partial [Chloroflexota bacterium]|nr:hypothetical protein [Chloroflexota bacterium]
KVGGEDDLEDTGVGAGEAVRVVTGSSVNGGARVVHVRAQVDAGRNPSHADHHRVAARSLTGTSGPIRRADRPDDASPVVPSSM